MITRKEKFLFPTYSGKKVQVTATMVDKQNGEKPTLHVRFKNEIQRSVIMTKADHTLLAKVLVDVFKDVSKGKTVEEYLARIEKKGGPRIGLKDRLAIAKRAWKDTKQLKTCDKLLANENLDSTKPGIPFNP